MKEKEWHQVATTGDIVPGQPKIVTVAGKEIGVFFEKGRYFAILNYCPHFGAPVCLGRVSGAVTCDEDGKQGYDASRPILRCPWHRWEFDMETGRALAPIKERLKTYAVHVDGDEAPAEEQDEKPTEQEGVTTFQVRVEKNAVWVEV